MCKHCAYSFLAGCSFVAGVALGSLYVTQRALEWQWENRWPKRSKQPNDFWDTRRGFVNRG